MKLSELDEAAAEYAMEKMKTRVGEPIKSYSYCVIDFMNGAKWQKEHEWISVKDKLPDSQDLVLVKTDQNSFAVGYYHGSHNGFILYGEEAYVNFGEVIHWRYL